MKSISERLREERKKRGMTQIQAALEIGISLPYVTMIERGVTPAAPTSEKIESWLKKN